MLIRVNNILIVDLLVHFFLLSRDFNYLVCYYFDSCLKLLGVTVLESWYNIISDENDSFSLSLVFWNRWGQTIRM